MRYDDWWHVVWLETTRDGHAMNIENDEIQLLGDIKDQTTETKPDGLNSNTPEYGDVRL
jgi:hypothetical protein